MFRSIFAIVGLGSMGQAVALACSPLLTRLYTPEAYGQLSTVLAIGGVLMVAAHLRLPLAVSLAPDDSSARRVVGATIRLICVVTVAAVPAIACYFLFNGDALYVALAFSLAIVVFSAAAATIDLLNYWFARCDRHALAAKFGFIRVVSTVAVQIALSCLQGVGLILGPIIGGVVCVVLGLRSGDADRPRLLDSVQQKVSIKQTLREYSQFPIYSFPQGLLASASLNAAPILIAANFGVVAAGQYWLAYRMLIAPISILGGGYRQVMYAKVVGARRPLSHLVGEARLHTLVLFAVCAPVAVVTYVFGAELFSLVFGRAWAQAGYFAAWLSIAFMLDIVKIPSVILCHALRLQSVILGYEGVLFLARILSLSFFLSQGVEDVVAIYAIAGALTTVIFCVGCVATLRFGVAKLARG